MGVGVTTSFDSGGTNNFLVCAAVLNSEKSLGITELLCGST